MSFSLSQTFLIDPAAVQNSTKINISEVQLYFRAKPRIIGNKSGIYAPGVQIGIVPTKFGVPLIGQTGVNQQIEWSRLEYGAIQVSADASLESSFRFFSPQLAYSGLEYAIIIKFDGDEDFLLWTNKQGDKIIGTTTPSPGASGRYIGKLYTFISPTGASTGTGIGYSNSSVISNSSVMPVISGQEPSPIELTQEYLLSTWKPLDNIDLKFSVSVARYFHSGVPVTSNSTITGNPTNVIWGSRENVTTLSNNVLRVMAPSVPVEFVQYEKSLSKDTDISFGENIYQEQPFWTGGKNTYCTISVSNSTSVITGNSSFTLANGASFDWNRIFANSAQIPQSIVVVSKNHDGAGLDRVNVRQVQSITNGNLLAVDESLTFTNSAARFFVAPTARISSKLRSYGSFGKMVDILTLSDSGANDTCRFVNNCVEAISIAANGASYSNSDYIRISGFENVSSLAEVSGGYPALANVITNASGNLVSILLTNTGCGFVNTSLLTGANVQILKSTGGVPSETASTGTGASFTFTVDTTLKIENNPTDYFKGCKIVNLDALQIVPLLTIDNPSGTTYTVTHRTLYHSETTANTYSGKRYYVNNDATLTDFSVQNGRVHNFSANQVPTIPSRSNQYAIRFANGYVANSDVIGAHYSNSAVYLIDTTSNNDFSSISFGNSLFTSTYAKYIINNDYTNEHTNYGNAWAKHVTTKVAFADGRTAEDLLVYLTGYRPLGTDFKVYARIHNSIDDDSFDVKDWTLLEQTDGLGVYSNPSNPTDTKEFTYNFPAFPNTDYQSPGIISTTLGSNAIVGANTKFTDPAYPLAVGDLVLIRSQNFPNNYMVSVVGTISDNTHLTITEPVSNNGIVGDMNLFRIKYPKQAFNDILNSNVVTYYNTSTVKFDGYDTMQIKVVMISNNDHLIPKTDDVHGICVSA